MKAFLLVFLGGGLGSVLRYGAQMLLPAAQRTFGLPLPTLSVNIAGCFLIGLFYAVSERTGLSSETRLLLTTGLCGGLTTFSTFSSESLGMIRAGEWTVLSLYLGLSLILGILAAWAGWAMGGR